MVNVPAAERSPRAATVRRWPPVTLHSGWPYGLAAAAVVVVPTTYVVAGPVAAPIAFILVGAVLALFRVELRRLASHAPATRVRTPLGVHEDIAVGAGRPMALAAAAIGLVATNALVACGYGALAVLVGTVWSTGPPWWSVVAGAWLVVAAAGLSRAGRLEARGRWALPALDLAVVIGLLAILFLTADTAPLTAPGRVVPAEAAALVVAVLGLCGFGASLAPVTSAVDPVQPPPDRPAALSLLLDPPAVVLLAGLLLAGVAWSVGGARTPGSSFVPGDVDSVLWFVDRGAGATAARVVGIACAISLLAALLAAHRAGSGLLFVLGHQRLLPPVLARSARRTAAPRVASVVQSLLTGLVIVATAGLGRDPYRDLFVGVGLIGALGVLVLATVTVWVSLADAIRRGTLGAVTVLAAVTATVVLAAAVWGCSLSLGLTTRYGLVLHAIYPVAALVGLIWAAVLRRRPSEPPQGPHDHEVNVTEPRRS